MGSPYRAWLVLVLLLVALGAAYKWAAPTDTKMERVEIPAQPTEKTKPNIPDATLEPGRVVVLQTGKGTIEFVLLEKDCPKTTEFIARLVLQGRCNGVKFSRVEKNRLIKTSSCAAGAEAFNGELRRNLLHEKGAVGLAKWSASKGDPGAFYICLEPLHHLDYDYTVFGRLIAGMDVARRMQVGDVITRATIRPLNDLDKKRFSRMLELETERRTQ